MVSLQLLHGKLSLTVDTGDGANVVNRWVTCVAHIAGGYEVGLSKLSLESYIVK